MFPFSRSRSAKKTTTKRRSTHRPRVQLVVEQLENRVVPSALIPVSDPRGLVYDPVLNQLEIINGGSVLQFSTQYQQIVGSIGVSGGNLDGADVTSDGNYLYVTDPALYGSQGEVHKINLNTHAITNLTYTHVSGETGTWDVALGANGIGLLDTTNTSSSMVPLRQINLNTGALTTLTSDPGAGGAGKLPSNTLISRSADRSLFLFTESNLSTGPIFTYSPNTNTFTAGPNLGANLTNSLSAVNRNGTLMAIEGPGGLLVMDQHFNVHNFLQGLDGGVAFDPNQDVMYAVDSATDQIVAYNTDTWQVMYQMAVGQTTTPGQAFGTGVMTVSSDSKWLFLTTPSGVREYSLPDQNPATHFSISGSFNGITTAGASFSITVTALDASNQIDSGYLGTLKFSSSDAQAVLPANYTFTYADAGVHTFNFTLKTVGQQNIGWVDVNNPNLGFLTPPITVNPGALAGFDVSDGNPETSGGGYENIPVAAGYVSDALVSARDAYGNLITNFTGTVHFSSSDPTAVLPADYTFTASDSGVQSFPVTFGTVGNQTLTATDTANTSAQGSTTVQVANYIPDLHFSVSSTASFVPAGTPFSFTVTALDVNGQVATRYAGTLGFYSSDHAAGVVLPANYTFTAADAGIHTFSATLVTAANPASVSFYDTQWITGGGPGGGVDVAITPAAASTLVASGFPTSTTAGNSGSFTVTAKDPYGNVATGYTGTVHFTSSDPLAVLPADYTFTSSDHGVHTFSVALKTAGVQSLTATDITSSSLSSNESGITVTPAAASSFAVTGFPSSDTVGTAGTFTVTALDAYGNVATGYTGTVQFTSSDPQVVLPADYTFTAANAGVNSFSATLNTPGLQSITATDTGAPTLTGSEAGIYVNPVASSFSVTDFPTTTTAGTAATFTVSALDANGNLATGYLGTVHFTSSDPQAVLPADYTFTAADQGTHTFTVTLLTAGSQSLSASDLFAPAVTGSEAGINVTAAAASSFLVSGYPSTVVAGTPGSITVTAVDSFGNVATGYTGTVHFTSLGVLELLPADYTFTAADQGVHVFAVTLFRGPTETITVTDVATSAITGSESGISITPAQAAQIVLAYPTYPLAGVAFSLIVYIMDDYGNIVTNWTGTVHFQSSDPQAVLPADYTYTAADQGSHVFDVTLSTLGPQTVQITDTAGILYSWPMDMTVVS
jgi:hypothetical protein